MNIICPEHKMLLKEEKNTRYICPSGCSFPVKDNIPRFVSIENYASSFGLQWNEYIASVAGSARHSMIDGDRPGSGHPTG